MTTQSLLNINAIELFERELVAYELARGYAAFTGVNLDASSQLLKIVLLTLISSKSPHTHSMMRCLVSHIKGQLDTNYSDHIITKMAANNADPMSRNLLMNVLYATRCVVVGEQVTLDDAWLEAIGNNTAIQIFLQNYDKNDITIGKKAEGESTINTVCTTGFTKSAIPETILTIGVDSGLVKLVANVAQKIKFDVPASVKAYQKLAAAQTIIMPEIGRFILDKTISFTPDAQMQCRELQCIGNDHIRGVDTLVTLPGLFHSLALSIMTNDGGDHWLITEANILPPCMVREMS